MGRNGRSLFFLPSLIVIFLFNYTEAIASLAFAHRGVDISNIAVEILGAINVDLNLTPSIAISAILGLEPDVVAV